MKIKIKNEGKNFKHILNLNIESIDYTFYEPHRIAIFTENGYQKTNKYFSNIYEIIQYLLRIQSKTKWDVKVKLVKNQF